MLPSFPFFSSKVKAGPPHTPPVGVSDSRKRKEERKRCREKQTTQMEWPKRESNNKQDSSGTECLEVKSEKMMKKKRIGDRRDELSCGGKTKQKRAKEAKKERESEWTTLHPFFFHWNSLKNEY